MGLTLAQLYRWEGEDFGQKHMGLKQGAIGNILGEHTEKLGNILGTWWELEKNMLGTKEKRKKNHWKGNPLTPNLKNLKKKIQLFEKYFKVGYKLFLKIKLN